MKTQLGFVLGRFALPLAALLLAASVEAAMPVSRRAPQGQTEAFGWQVTDAKVVSPGTTGRAPDGTLTQGYAVEAVAVATTPGTPVPRGVFQLTVTAFRPLRDLPGQKAGVWYVRGTWSVTDEQASAAELAARHSPAVVRGSLSAELTFDPAVQAGAVEALLTLPLSPDGGRWSRGSGSFSGNERFEGEMRIDAVLLPDVSASREVKP